MIRYGGCTRMHVADFLFIFSLLRLSSQALSLFVLSLFHTSSPLQLSLCFPSPLSLSLHFCFPLSLSSSVTHTNTGVIISGRLGVKVCYDKHAAVVINFE